jgi:hypothetical protein
LDSRCRVFVLTLDGCFAAALADSRLGSMKTIHRATRAGRLSKNYQEP